MTTPDTSNLPYWTALPSDMRERARDAIRAIVLENIDTLVGHFYSTLLEHPEASSFLSHSVVHERLSHSLRDWLRDLSDFGFAEDAAAFDARQTRIGEIHARLKIPIYLVLEGASLLKCGVAAKIPERGLDVRDVAAAIILFDEIIDYAMRRMSQAYVSGMAKRAQIDEAFRLFWLGQDVSLERESQRAALMEWSQSVLFRLFGSADGPLDTLSGSAFGLWLRHRAGVVFQGASALASLELLVGTMDGTILPRIRLAQAQGPTQMAQAIAEFQQRIDEIKFLLNELFQAAAGSEGGRDSLTRTLNRRFLPSVLGREINIAKASQSPLTLMMIDVDHFKQVNDEFGHSIGDIVLGNVAELLMSAVRASDFVFRYGGEEFLVLLCETPEDEALVIAERIRRQLAAHRIELPDTRPLAVTASIGLASYDGHPDYQYLIDAADRALYQAKKQGRDRIVVAQD